MILGSVVVLVVVFVVIVDQVVVDGPLRVDVLTFDSCDSHRHRELCSKRHCRNGSATTYTAG